MANWNDDVSRAKTWATGHLVLAGIICGLAGILVGAILF